MSGRVPPSGAAIDVATVASTVTGALAVAMLAVLGFSMPPLGAAFALLALGIAGRAILGRLLSPQASAKPGAPGAGIGIRPLIREWSGLVATLVRAVELPGLQRGDLAVGFPTARSIAALWRAAWAGFRPADLAVVAVALVGLGLRVHGALVAGQVGDVAAYADHVIRVKQGLAVYRDAGSFPYLPGWLGVEIGVGHLSDLLGIPFWLAIRMVIVTADFALIFAIWWLATLIGGRTRGRLAAGIYAASPIAILISGYHGQFDSMPLLLTVIATSLAVRGSRGLIWAGLLLGIAITLKPLAVLAVPAFLFASRWTFTQRLVTLSCAGVVVLAVSAPILITDPPALFRNVLGYGGVNDQGISGFLRALWMERTKSMYLPGELGKNLSATSKYLAVTIMAVTALLTWRYGLMRMCGAIYLAFLLTFGAISTQYLLWPLPFLLLGGLSLAVAVVYSLAAAAGAIGFYLVFWQPIIFGPGAPPFDVANARQYLAGQAIAWIVIACAYLISIAPALAQSRWKRAPAVIGGAVTLVSGVGTIHLVVYLLQEWWKATPK